MSIAGILSSNLFQTNSLQNNNQQQIQKEFQQLGQDLQAGSLTQAQSDFATITANQPTGLTSTSTSAQAFSALGQDLKSGNLSAAQQAFSTIQQAAQSGGGHVHHHHHGGTSRSAEPFLNCE
jgi:outer membrane protein assembly factor BamD (BamD/ComL family)